MQHVRAEHERPEGLRPSARFDEHHRRGDPIEPTVLDGQALEVVRADPGSADQLHVAVPDHHVSTGRVCRVLVPGRDVDRVAVYAGDPDFLDLQALDAGRVDRMLRLVGAVLAGPGLRAAQDQPVHADVGAVPDPQEPPGRGRVAGQAAVRGRLDEPARAHQQPLLPVAGDERPVNPIQGGECERGVFRHGEPVEHALQDLRVVVGTELFTRPQQLLGCADHHVCASR